MDLLFLKPFLHSSLVLVVTGIGWELDVLCLEKGTEGENKYHVCVGDGGISKSVDRTHSRICLERC